MIPVKRAMQISLVAVACLSGILLGLSQDNPQLMLIACGGAVTGFVLVDLLQVFRLRGWIANIVSIVVLLFSMWDFFDGSGAEKLISVANLLVYLQTTLMFQEKTVRLNWQVMILSLLQTVVAAIFNLDFEGGMLFILYFAVAGWTMVLQATLAENDEIRKSNRKSAGRLKQHLHPSALSPSLSTGTVPIAIYDSHAGDSGPLRRMTRLMVLWMVIGLTFTTVLFYSVPRGAQAWFGPKFRSMARTGFSKSVNLNETGLIRLSSELVLRIWFQPSSTRDRAEERIRINGPIYVRGMALGSLDPDSEDTSWVAPYDRLHDDLYSRYTGFPPAGNRLVRQFVTLEATEDPLIYSVTPAFADPRRTPFEIEFCHELSAFTRVRSGEEIDYSPYSYQLITILSPTNQLLGSWPYFSDLNSRPHLPLSENRGKWKWLTSLRPERYPTLVATARELAAENEAAGGGQRELFEKLETYFLDPSRFQYTLDYREVPRVPGLDPVEDFFANHRSGHCELYASALTLMLRSLDIPARLVVGFHTNEYSELTESYMVRASHAHAWVEAYLPPDQCSLAMRREGSAGPGGAWVTLDPTPLSEAPEEGGESTIELARTLWQDYVLGLDQKNQPQAVLESTTRRMLGLLDLSQWSAEFDDVTAQVSRNPFLQTILIVVLLAAILFGLARTANQRWKRPAEGRASKAPVGLLRRVVGSALGWISPELETWVLRGVPGEIRIGFYRRLTRLLAKRGLTREVDQTQREFAAEAEAHFAEHPEAPTIARAIRNLTDHYYEVRFGHRRLARETLRELESDLQRLEQLLARPLS